jgi:hypothetical protein
MNNGGWHIRCIGSECAGYVSIVGHKRSRALCIEGAIPSQESAELPQIIALLVIIHCISVSSLNVLILTILELSTLQLPIHVGIDTITYNPSVMEESTMPEKLKKKRRRSDHTEMKKDAKTAEDTETVFGEFVDDVNSLLISMRESGIHFVGMMFADDALTRNELEYVCSNTNSMLSRGMGSHLAEMLTNEPDNIYIGGEGDDDMEGVADQ